MFERFTREAKQAMSEARNAALRLRHDYIGTEHMLLGLVANENAAMDVLSATGIDGSRIPAAVEAVVKRGRREVAATQLPFTPASKNTLELSMEAATDLNDAWLGIQHLLMGLLAERNGIAARILTQLGADLETVTAEVARRWPATDRAATEPTNGAADLDLLLAWLADEGSLLSEVVAELGLDRAFVRATILRTDARRRPQRGSSDQ